MIDYLLRELKDAWYLRSKEAEQPDFKSGAIFVSVPFGGFILKAEVLKHHLFGQKDNPIYFIMKISKLFEKYCHNC